MTLHPIILEHYEAEAIAVRREITFVKRRRRAEIRLAERRAAKEARRRALLLCHACKHEHEGNECDGLDRWGFKCECSIAIRRDPWMSANKRQA